MVGGAGTDVLHDGETDAQAATDIYRGGSQRRSVAIDGGDVVSYSKRRRALEIDLRGDPVSAAPEGDELDGIEGVRGGASGTTGSQAMQKRTISTAGPGTTVSMAAAGTDFVDGGADDDTVSGGGDSDYPHGRGRDRLVQGRAGRRHLVSVDSNAETLRCGSGADNTRSSRVDTLVDCEVASTLFDTETLYVKVQPAISGDTATFQLACQDFLISCDGSLALTGPNGEDYGTGSYAGLPSDPADVLAG